MTIKKGKDNFFEEYVEQAQQTPASKKIFECAYNFANQVEETLSEIFKNKSFVYIDRIFEQVSNQSLENLTGAEKNAVYVMLVKCWEYGDHYDNYINQDASANYLIEKDLSYSM